jgi:hypothetical protein
MADDNNFDIPKTGNEAQENADRNRRRKTPARRWDLRSPVVRDRARQPRIRVNLDPSTGEFAGIVRDAPAVPSRMTEVTAGSGVETEETLTHNVEHAAGKHAETPDLQGCVACQFNARKRAKNAALEDAKRLLTQYDAHPEHVKAHIRGMMVNGYNMAQALDHVRKNRKKFGLSELPEETETPAAPKKSGRGKAAIAAAEEVKGAPLEEWEKLIAMGKTVAQIVLTDEDRRRIHSKNTDAPLPAVPEVKPLEMFKKHPETGELIPYDTRDYIRYHTAEHKKAQAAGDSAAAKFHLKRLRVLKGEEPEVETRQGDYIPATGRWEHPIISRDEAVNSLIHADDTGQDQCFMKCRMSEIHSQCPKHGQLLTPE